MRWAMKQNSKSFQQNSRETSTVKKLKVTLCQFQPKQTKHDKNESSNSLKSLTHKVSDNWLRHKWQWLPAIATIHSFCIFHALPHATSSYLSVEMFRVREKQHSYEKKHDEGAYQRISDVSSGWKAVAIRFFCLTATITFCNSSWPLTCTCRKINMKNPRVLVKISWQNTKSTTKLRIQEIALDQLDFVKQCSRREICCWPDQVQKFESLMVMCTQPALLQKDLPLWWLVHGWTLHGSLRAPLPLILMQAQGAVFQSYSAANMFHQWQQPTHS